MATARDRVEESRRRGRAADRPPPDQSPAVVPRQLPAAVPGFVGRTAELATLFDLAAGPAAPGTVVICAVSGMAGIGKTALAVQAGHRLAARFPDGQLFVDLHGFTAGVAPVPPAQALDRLLRDVGVPGELIPSGLPEARRHWQHALDILTNLGTDHTEEIDANAANIRAHLTGLDRRG